MNSLEIKISLFKDYSTITDPIDWSLYKTGKFKYVNTEEFEKEFYVENTINGIYAYSIIRQSCDFVYTIPKF